MVVICAGGPSIDTALTGDAFYVQFTDALFYYKESDDRTGRQFDLDELEIFSHYQ